MILTGAAAWAAYVLVLFLGLSVGSFLNVVIFRLPREDLSIAQPRRSFCPNCQKPIRWYDNIPVFSWFILRGRCRSCRQPIAVRYPLVELVSGLLALYFFHIFGPSLNFIFHFYLAECLLAIALIDLELMVIPTRALVYPPAVVGLINAVLNPNPALAGPWLWAKLAPSFGLIGTSLGGALMGLALGWGSLALVSAAYKIARGHEGMGDGDPPLLALIGIWLGWRAVPLVILSSTLIGVASVAVLMAMSKGRSPEEGWGKKELPFGPFLVLGAFLYLFFGPAFLEWYWSLAY